MAERLYSLFGQVRSRSPMKFGLKKTTLNHVHTSSGKQMLLTPKKAAWALSEVKNTIHNKLSPRKGFGKYEVNTPHLVKSKPKEEPVEVYEEDITPHNHPEYIDDFTDIHPLGLTKKLEEFEEIFTNCAPNLETEPPISDDSFSIDDLKIVVPQFEEPILDNEFPDFDFAPVVPVPEELDFSF